MEQSVEAIKQPASCQIFQFVGKTRQIPISRRFFIVILISFFVAGMIGFSSVLAHYLYENQKKNAITSAEEDLRYRKIGMHGSFLEDISRVSGLPVVLADGKQVIETLVAANAKDYSALTQSEKKETWAQQPDLVALDRHLQVAKQELLYDVVWVMNMVGDCIASSNASENQSFVGINYADRIYFQKAAAGELGFQYAVERQTGQPGLFFSAPIVNDGRIIGVLTTKIPILRLQRYVENSPGFIVDENGIVIVAHEPDMVMNSVKDKRIAAISPDVLLARYNRTSFNPINIRAAEDPDFPQLMRVGDRPGYYLFSDIAQSNSGLEFHVYTKLASFDEIKKTVIWQAFVVGGGLSLLFLLVTVFFVYNHQIRYDNEELKRNERELLRLNQELDGHRRDAEEANRVKSEFLANMSHEIRTPLNGLLASAEMLAQTNLGEDQKKFVDIMRSSGEMLLVVINDILDLSKIEAKKIELRPAPFDIHRESQSIGDIYSAQAEAKNLGFSFTVDSNVPQRITEDVFRLRQIMSNLISNAIKYTQMGSVKARLMTIVNESDRRLRFEVVDTGIGVPKESQKFIFEKFAQVYRKESINGTGLGLAICQALIEMMGGQIGVDSDGCNGSTFWFEIPFVEAPILEPDRDQRLEVVMARANHAGCRVLLAEDIEMNRIVAAEMLRQLGCIVDTVNDGRQALNALAKKSYDLVFMDCNMPNMNGYEAVQAIRRNGDVKTPVVALTAHAFTEEINKCYDVGMNDFISKPIKHETLGRVLDKWHTGNLENPPVTPGKTAADTTDISVIKPFDFSVLDEWHTNMPAKISELIDLSLKDSSRLYGELAQAIISNNAASVADCAHALKSVASQIGGNELARLCKVVELMAKEEKLNEAPAEFEKIRIAYQEFIKSINSQKNKYQE